MNGAILPKVWFASSCLVLAFIYGVVVERYEVFPYSILEFGRKSLTAVYQEKENLLG